MVPLVRPVTFRHGLGQLSGSGKQSNFEAVQSHIASLLSTHGRGAKDVGAKQLLLIRTQTRRNSVDLISLDLTPQQYRALQVSRKSLTAKNQMSNLWSFLDIAGVISPDLRAALAAVARPSKLRPRWPDSIPMEACCASASNPTTAAIAKLCPQLGFRACQGRC